MLHISIAVFTLQSCRCACVENHESMQGLSVMTCALGRFPMVNDSDPKNSSSSNSNGGNGGENGGSGVVRNNYWSLCQVLY